MKQYRFIILGFYDLLLSVAAIFCGILMVNSSYGIFSTYPPEWISVLPFKNWIIPGIVTIAVFGIGNIIAAFFSFRQKDNRSWFVSALMGGIFLTLLVMQVLLLGKYYLATFEFLVFCVLQLILSGYALIKR